MFKLHQIQKGPFYGTGYKVLIDSLTIKRKNDLRIPKYYLSKPNDGIKWYFDKN